MLYKSRPTLLAVIALIVALAIGSGSALGQSVEEFYSGNILRIVVGYTEGGGYDTYARVLARHIGRHIPGNPHVVVENMPGAGSLVAANWLFRRAPRDGTVIATFARGLPLNELVQVGEIDFVSTEFNWIGSMNEEVAVCVVRQDVPHIRTFEDVFEREFVVGGMGVGADPDFFPDFLNGVLDTKFRVIRGYPGTADISLALERGEVDGRCGWSWSSLKATRPDWIETGYVKLLVQIAMNKHPELPHVPLLLEYTDDPEIRQLFEVAVARQVMGRPYIAPPGVPAERVRALRDAFWATLQDPEFLAEATRADLEINPVSGDDLQQLIHRIFQTPRHLVNQLADILG